MHMWLVKVNFERVLIVLLSESSRTTWLGYLIGHSSTSDDQYRSRHTCKDTILFSFLFFEKDWPFSLHILQINSYFFSTVSILHMRKQKARVIRFTVGSIDLWPWRQPFPFLLFDIFNDQSISFLLQFHWQTIDAFFSVFSSFSLFYIQIGLNHFIRLRFVFACVFFWHSDVVSLQMREREGETSTNISHWTLSNL